MFFYPLPLGCFGLGLLYHDGKGIKQDYFKAVEFYKKACDGGQVIGCFNLGHMYRDGLGVKQNKKIAKELFGIVCDGQDANGCENYKILNEQGY